VKNAYPDIDGYNFGVRMWAKFTELSGPTEPVTIGGNVSGLEGSGLVLQNNGDDDEPISADGGFTFDTPLTPSSTYNVTVKTQPSNPAQTCTVANGSGTVPTTDVTNVAVTCTDQQPPVGATVIFDPEDSTQAIGIKNLDIGGTLYNVAFTASGTTAAQVYDTYPGTFDFVTNSTAADAANAVNAALNDFDARTLGAKGSAGSPWYRIGFESESVEELQAVIFWESAKDDPLQAVDTDPWVKFPNPDIDSYPAGVRIWATFTPASPGFLPAIYQLLLLNN
jgi:hypothetical protein